MCAVCVSTRVCVTCVCVHTCAVSQGSQALPSSGKENWVREVGPGEERWMLLAEGGAPHVWGGGVCEKRNKALSPEMGKGL